METTENIRKKYFDEGVSGEDIERHYLRTYLMVLSQQKTLESSIVKNDFMIQLLELAN